MKTYDIDGDLTVTVHSDATVGWSSSFPMTLEQVKGALERRRKRYRILVEEQDELEASMRLAEQGAPLKPSEVVKALEREAPCRLPVMARAMLGIVCLEYYDRVSPRECAPNMRVAYEALTRAGYRCEQTGTRLWVRRRET